jgi:tetratricopeptide (TPR) repeat protein
VAKIRIAVKNQKGFFSPCIFCYNLSMDIWNRLKELKKNELVSLARELKVTGYSKLKKQALRDHIKANYTEQEIRVIIDIKLSWWEKIKRPLLNWIGVFGGIASIIALILFFSDKCDIAKEKETNAYYQNLQERHELSMKGYPIDYINGLGENPLLKHYLEKGRELSKESLYEQAITEFKKCLSHPKATHSNKVAAHIQIGNCYYSLSRLADAGSHYKEALNLSGKVEEKDERLSGESAALGNIGLIYSSLGKPEEALKYHRDALAIDRKIGYEQGIASDLGNIGLIYSDLGKPEEALKYHQEALAIDRKIG